MTVTNRLVCDRIVLITTAKNSIAQGLSLPNQVKVSVLPSKVFIRKSDVMKNGLSRPANEILPSILTKKITKL